MEDVIEISDSEREETSSTSEMEVDLQEIPDAEQIVPKDAATWVNVISLSHSLSTFVSVIWK